MYNRPKHKIIMHQHFYFYRSKCVHRHTFPLSCCTYISCQQARIPLIPLWDLLPPFIPATVPALWRYSQTQSLYTWRSSSFSNMYLKLQAVDYLQRVHPDFYRLTMSSITAGFGRILGRTGSARRSSWRNPFPRETCSCGPGENVTMSV